MVEGRLWTWLKNPPSSDKTGLLVVEAELRRMGWMKDVESHSLFDDDVIHLLQLERRIQSDGAAAAADDENDDR